MGTTALIIAIAYLIVVVIGAALAIVLARSTRARRREVDTAAVAHRERGWLVVVIVIMSCLLFGTIFLIPYGDESAAADAQVVQVEAQQFGWSIDPTSVVAGTEVEFRLTSIDVNHGFGVYDEAGVLLFQVQVIPGWTQRALYTFEEPGTYEILCMEFCGVSHHLMTGRIEVVAP
jgi:cytochrome c oxidase subunit 2